MKKPSVVTFLIALLLAAAVCTHGKDEELVKDTAGNPLEIGQQYFIQPIKTKSNNGGGLVPAAISVLHFCPLGITQTLLPYQPGVPVSFGFPYVTYRATDITIKTTNNVNIYFRSDIWPVCNEFSKFWEVDDSSSAAKEPAILIGGKPLRLNTFFKIEKAEGVNTYKLTTSTGTVGATPGAWLSAPQLVLTNDTAKTLFVKFNKVDDATSTTTSTSRVEKLGLRMFPFN